MIEEYIKLLESFKQNQISKLLERIDIKVFDILYSKHVSSRIEGYFPRYEFCIMADETELEPNKLYIKEQTGKIAYSVIAPNGELVKEVILEELDAPSPLTMESLGAIKARILSTAARKGHIHWAPFTSFSLDPDNISQIKKLINALYYARLTFLDLETVNIRQKYSDLKILYSRTINLAYEASYLATHLDVDLKEMFHDELAFLLPLLSQIQRFAENQGKEKPVVAKALHPEALAYKAGEVTGIAIDQMRPLGGDVDYNFLTQFSAVLPSYIHKLTQYIQQYSSEIQEAEPKLNKKKLDELQSAALSLLNDIENLKGNSVFVSLKFLNYIHIINSIITLSMSSLEQIGELSESSQDLVRDKLAQLKYTVLPNLFGLVDKIEDNAMLKPGTLSVPLMKKVKVLYDALLYLPKKAVDFKTKGEELLEIEDSRFIESRLERSYKRIDKANRALYKIQKAREACAQFFEILNNPLYKDSRLYQFSPEVKAQLINHYKLIKPYMTALDIDLNELIITRLTGAEKEDWSSYLNKPWRWARKQLPSDHISFVLAKQSALQNLIVKDENSQLFHINLNKDLIDSVHKKAKLVLFPYCEKTSAYELDESIPLQIESDADKKSKLAKTEFQRIRDAYSQFAQIIKVQIAAKPTLYENNLDLNHLDEETKKECHRLYNIFHPFLGSVIPAKFKDFSKNLDQYLAELFAKKTVTNTPATKLFLTFDNNLENFFARISFEWFDRTEFQNVLAAYTAFSELIKSQIAENPRLYENNLLLTSLSSTLKDKCREFYTVFQPYLKFAVSPKLEDAVQNFESYLTALLSNRPLDILETPPTALFVELDKNILDFFSKWQDKKPIYYDFSKGKFLSEEQSTKLQSKREQDALLRFKIIESDKLLQNTDQLSADQALELCQWYNNKYNKFLVAQEAYIQFTQLLKEQIATNPEIQGDHLLLEKLDPKVKDQCRNLYNIFQAYFISAIPPEKKEEALKFDKYLVALLSSREIDKRDAPLVKMVFDLEEHLQDHFEGVKIEWNRRAQAFKDLAKEKFAVENAAMELMHDSSIGKRAHYVIQHTNYSKCVREFRKSLFEVTSRFNHAMQTELTPKKSGVPFPEMEDDNKRLMQSKQVCALKDIYNSMFHLEGIALELENLNNKSAKSTYVYYLLQAYGHVNEIIKLSNRLTRDPHLGFMARDLLNKAQTLYATLQEQSDPYQADPEQVPYEKTAVQTNSLWYVLNAFYISPHHIRALNNNNYLSTEELNALHLRAKKATLFIEGLIKNSDSYFKLFLQAPNMIYLYRELTTKLNEFTSTTHDTALNNLDKMRSTLLTPMLVEADRWEDRLGLAPGSLSGPLKQITDEFYKGLLHPLDLNSQTHIALICDKKPLEERITRTKKNSCNAKKFLKKLDKEYHNIEHLYACIETHNKLRSPTQAQLEQSKSDLADAYKKALPKLTKLKLKKKVVIEPSQYPEDHRFDDLCNSGLKEYDPHFTEIEALITASHHYYLGLKATHQMRLDTAEEKLVYLNELAKTQEKENQAFVEKYTNESFEKHLAALCNRHIGLQYTDKEYRAKLKEYLLHFKDEIVTTSKIATDINLSIKKLLTEKISAFEDKHYAEYYHLDSVKVALDQFKNYLSYSTEAICKKRSLFESKNTLEQKKLRIDALDEIAENTKLSVKERLNQIIIQVENPNFSRIILAHKQVDHLNFTYLRLCFLSLLEALHLYKPARKKLLDNINATIKNPPEISELTQRFGLFASTKAKDEKTKRYEPPTMPIEVPTA